MLGSSAPIRIMRLCTRIPCSALASSGKGRSRCRRSILLLARRASSIGMAVVAHVGKRTAKWQVSSPRSGGIDQRCTRTPELNRHIFRYLCNRTTIKQNQHTRDFNSRAQRQDTHDTLPTETRSQVHKLKKKSRKSTYLHR